MKRLGRITRIHTGGLALLLLPGLALSEPGHQLEFHGYIRTGLGLSEGGATQADFQAPGALGRYRLGNEANTNYEFAIDYRYDLANTSAPEGAFIQGYFMVDDFANFGDSAQLGLDRMAQAYIKFGGFLSPGVEAWAGRRYYDRKVVYMNSYYWINPGQNAQAGAGIEGWRLGPGVMNAALFRMEDAGVSNGTVTGTVNSTLMDLRYGKLAMPSGGSLTLWAQAAQRARHEALGLDAKPGFAVGLWHDQPKTWGGSNTTALLYREGAAVPQGPFNPNPVREDQGYDLDGVHATEVNNSLLVEPDAPWSMQWVVVARETDFGQRGTAGSKLRWYSTGVRPVWYFTDHVNLAVEAGVDYVDDEVHDRNGNLRKYTVALQLAKARGYLARPVLRLFVTRADWSESFKGLVGTTPGDAPYGTATDGWSAGTQVEAWW